MADQAPETDAMPRLLAVPSQDAMFEFLTGLNVSGHHPELPCIVSGGGRPFLASLTDPDADYVHITSNGSGGSYECCNCMHPETPHTEWCESLWEPTYPVLAVVTEWPDLARCREDEIPTWWAS